MSKWKVDAVIVDIDGTLAQRGERGPFDWARVGEDTLIEPIRHLVHIFQDAGYEILPVSGRSDECFLETEEWLERHMIPGDRLFMRKAGDYRDDTIVKREIYEQSIQPYFNVDYVLDDRNKVVAMWRSLGLTVLQVADGDF